MAAVFIILSPCATLAAQHERVLLNACAPVAVYVAATWTGHDTNIPDIVEACQWVEGETCEVRSVLSGLEDLAIPHAVARLTSHELAQLLSGRYIAAAILLVRQDPEGPVGHLAVAVTIKEDRFVIIDYPHLVREWDTGKLTEHWTGDCIIVASAGTRLSTLPGFPRRSSDAGKMLYLLSVALAVCGFAALFVVRKARRRTQSKSLLPK